jgi:hypothetical protein
LIGSAESEIAARVGQAPAGELERRIGARKVEIVGVLIAAADREEAGADHIGEGVGDARRIAAIGKAAGQPHGDAEPALRQGEQHGAAVRGNTSAIERGCDFLALDGWKGEGGKRIVVHGGRGAVCSKRKGWVSATEPYAVSATYATLASLRTAPSRIRRVSLERSSLWRK